MLSSGLSVFFNGLPEAGALVPGVLFRLEGIVGFLVIGVAFVEVGLGVSLEGVVAGLVKPPAFVALGAADLGLGLDSGSLDAVDFAKAVGLVDPVGEEVCPFLVALAALKRLVLVGLILSELGSGDGLVKGVVLVENGVLGEVVTPAVVGLFIGVVFISVVEGLADCGLEVVVFVLVDGVFASFITEGLVDCRVVAAVGFNTSVF